MNITKFLENEFSKFKEFLDYEIIVMNSQSQWMTFSYLTTEYVIKNRTLLINIIKEMKNNDNNLISRFRNIWTPAKPSNSILLEFEEETNYYSISISSELFLDIKNNPIFFSNNSAFLYIELKNSYGTLNQPLFLEISTFENDIKLTKNKEISFKSKITDINVIKKLVKLFYKDGEAKLEKLLEKQKDKDIGIFIETKCQSNSKYELRTSEGYKLYPKDVDLFDIANFINSGDIESIKIDETTCYFDLKNIHKFKVVSTGDKYYFPVKYGKSKLPIYLNQERKKIFVEKLKELGYKAREKFPSNEIDAWLILLEIDN